MFIIPDEPVPLQSCDFVKGITAVIFALVVIYHIDFLRDARNIFQIGITIRNINDDPAFGCGNPRGFHWRGSLG
jgi:hypothetical protein